jgi:endoglucanase
MPSSPYHQWLVELTNTPTATGKEDRVIAWITNYVKSHRNVVMKSDKYGNLVLSRKNVKPNDSPIYITAHMDHPAFVVHEIIDAKTLIAEFRGGVKPEYFNDAPVNLYHGDDEPVRGKCIKMLEDPDKHTDFADYKLARIAFSRKVNAHVGDILTWALPQAKITKGMLHAPAVDDLGGLAAAMAAFDSLADCKEDVRLLFTRAEEMAFIGAIAACKAKTIEKKARLVCLETSKSFADSPIGAGPIVRVGDYTSTFDPDLTYRISKIAREMEKEPETLNFQWQRKLMPGGTCEASAFGSYGFISTCLCLPLGNYHNMNEDTQTIKPEFISVADFDGLVQLLVEVGKRLNNAQQSPGLKPVLEDLFAKRKRVL